MINTSALAFVYVAAHAFVSSAAMCGASGAPLDLFADVVGTFTAKMSPMFDEYVAMIAAGSYESSSLRLATGAQNLQAITEQSPQALMADVVDRPLSDQELCQLRQAPGRERSRH